jgi:Putative polyhydroxyalkanoic acid system protein (PHA_gran_rgn)
MPRINIEVTHSLFPDEALNLVRQVVENELPIYKKDVNITKLDWGKNSVDYVFSVRNLEFRGKLVCIGDKVTLISNLPIILLPFKSQITAQIRQKLKEALSL